MREDEPRQTLDQFKADVRSALESAMNETADVIVAGIRDDISDSYPPASKPHTPPHSRTGQLLQGVGQQTYRTDSGVTSTIYVNRAGGDIAIPIYLEEGTSKMSDRAFMRPSFEEWNGKFMTIMPEVLEAHLAGAI